MPTRRRFKKRPYKKRQFNNPRKYSQISKAVMRVNDGPVPDRLYTKLVYSDDFVITAGGGGATLGRQNFRGNSIFDPDQSGAGHQPLGRDQWVAFYNKYVVFGSKIEITAGSAQGFPSTISVIPATTIPTATTLTTAVEHPRLRYRFLTTERPAYMKYYMGTKTMFGVKNVKDNQALYTNTGSNPGSEWFWSVASMAIDQTTASSIFVIVKITYYVMFSGRVYLAQS